MPLPVEHPEIVTVRIENAGNVLEFPLTRDEYNEIAIEAAVRGLEIDDWIKVKLLAGADDALAQPEGAPAIADKRGLS